MDGKCCCLDEWFKRYRGLTPFYFSAGQTQCGSVKRTQCSKQRRSNVGAGLLAKAVVQSKMYSLSPRSREQVESSHRRSHRESALNWHWSKPATSPMPLIALLQDACNASVRWEWIKKPVATGSSRSVINRQLLCEAHRYHSRQIPIRRNALNAAQAHQNYQSPWMGLGL